MAEYTSCDDCRHSDKGLRDFPCTVCIHNAIDKFEPKTNADVIRAMSDEELAEFLVNFKNTFGKEYEGEMSCLEWLKSEVKE